MSLDPRPVDAATPRAGDRIRLRNLRVFGSHGVLPHERAYGQVFVIDLDLGLDLAAAGTSDRLEDTVDYGRLASAVAALVAGAPRQLIESVAAQVAGLAFDFDPRVDDVRVRVTKPHAPLQVDAEVSVELTRTRDGRGVPS